MSVNLKKIANDLLRSDQDIQILALTTISQLHSSSVENPEEWTALKEALEHIAASGDADLVFLARKSLNHLQSLKPGSPRTVPAGARPPRPNRSRDELLGILRQNPDVGQIASALTELGRLKDPGDLDLVEKFLTHGDARVRGNAVEALESLADEKLLTRFLSPMIHDENNRVRGNVVKALGKIGYPKIVEIIREMQGTNNLSMLESATWAMSYIKGPEMVDMLMECLHHPYEGIRLRAVQGLAKHKDPRSLPALKEMMNDIDINICEEAEKAIALLRGTTTLDDADQVIDLSCAEPEEDVADQVAAENEPTMDELFPVSAAPQDLQSAAESILAAQPRIRLPDISGMPPEKIRALLADKLVEMGGHIFLLIRKNELIHEDCNKDYYDLLKFQEMLKKAQEREKEKTSQSVLASLQQSLTLGKSSLMANLEKQMSGSKTALALKALSLLRRKAVHFKGADQFLALITFLEESLSPHTS